MKKLFFAVMMLSALALLTVFCFADEAEQLKISVSAEPAGMEWSICDGVRYTKQAFTNGGRVTIKCDEDMAALYLIWDAPAPEKTAVLSGGNVTISENGFIHDFIPLKAAAKEAVISFEGAAALCDIYAFSAGETPDWVQVWQKSDAPCDILFLPTHADDEMLYFGGAMALATERESEIQVAYMVNHNGEYYRPHELLNGLWELGVRRYPVIPHFPDIYSWSHEHAKTIYDESEILCYQVELIEKFKPQIIIGHDLKGEYGHGAHILNAYCLLDAIEQAEWQTKKLYLHLYNDNAIVLDGDKPLEKFNGATVFEMAQRGFACHKSQQQFFEVEQTGPYDMRKFGLYRSLVGEDSSNDIFENITLYRDAPKPEPVIEPEPAPESAEPIPEPVSSEPAPPPAEKEMILPEAKNDFAFTYIGSVMALVFSAALALAIALAVFLRKRR